MPRFQFNFHHVDNTTDDDCGVVVFFELTPPPDKLTPDNRENFSETYEYLDFVSNMESYGVHDFCTIGPEEFIGYHSYEIEWADQEDVINKWHDYFEDNGFKPGPIQILLYRDYEAQYR